MSQLPNSIRGRSLPPPAPPASSPHEPPRHHPFFSYRATLLLLFKAHKQLLFKLVLFLVVFLVLLVERSSVAYVWPSGMDLGWLFEFLKGMIKPVAATAVVLMAVILSFMQKLGLEGEMIYSIVRAFLQLSVIGFVLQFIFNQQHSVYIVLAYLFMVSVAGYTAGQRAKHVPRGKYVAGVSILSGTATTMFLLVVLNVFPFTPRYIIPVAGMMVGNAMTVTGVTMKRLRDDIKVQMNLVETALALGATPRQATLQQVKRALVIALSPVLDNAKTVGLISLPGAMTGLIMGGASPIEAIQLQIVVMNMLIGASTVSSIMSTYLCWPAFFTNAYQLETKVFSSE